MWARIKMVLRSLFGWMIRGAENPELVLRQLMDDMRQKLPELNVKAAEVVKFDKMLRMQIERSKKNVADLQAQQQKAATLNREDLFVSFDKQLNTEKAKLTDLEAQLVDAEKAANVARNAREQYRRVMDSKMNEAMRQISRAKQAQMKNEIAGLLSSFDVGDESDTLERMTSRIDEDLARADARLEMATSSYDGQLMNLESQTEEADSKQKFVEMRRQMGLIEEAPAQERTLEPIQETQATTTDAGAAEQQQ